MIRSLFLYEHPHSFVAECTRFISQKTRVYILENTYGVCFPLTKYNSHFTPPLAEDEKVRRENLESAVVQIRIVAILQKQLRFFFLEKTKKKSHYRREERNLETRPRRAEFETAIRIGFRLDQLRVRVCVCVRVCFVYVCACVCTYAVVCVFTPVFCAIFRLSINL